MCRELRTGRKNPANAQADAVIVNPVRLASIAENCAQAAGAAGQTSDPATPRKARLVGKVANTPPKGNAVLLGLSFDGVVKGGRGGSKAAGRQELSHKTIGTHVRCDADSDIGKVVGGTRPPSKSEDEHTLQLKTIGTHARCDAEGKVKEKVGEATPPPKDGKVIVSKLIGTHIRCETDGKLNGSTVLGAVLKPKPTASAKPCAIGSLPAAASGPKQVLTVAAAQKILGDYQTMSASMRAFAYGWEKQHQAKVQDIVALIEKLKADDTQRATTTQLSAAVASGQRKQDIATGNATPSHQHPQALPMPLAPTGDWPPLKAK